jgi:uridine kinase
MTQRPFFLGVAGGSGSGKTTVARAILDAVGRERISFIEQDSYYKDIDWQAVGHGPEQHNFDHPDALDGELLLHHVRELRQDRPVDVPKYDFTHHARLAETRRVVPRPVILVEGLLILAEPELRPLLDFKIFVDTDPDVRLIRRLRRDIHERGREPDDILRQYEDNVRPMHLEFIEPSKRYADVIIPEGGENRVALDMVVARVEKLLGERASRRWDD